MTIDVSAPCVEAIEGLSEGEEGGWGDFPLDALLIRTETRTVFDVVRRIERGSYVMDAEFQRDFVWDEIKQSKLIESVLMRIPLPVIYLAEDGSGRTIVVDGLQRLSTIRRFCSNELTLKLPDQEQLNEKTFQDLSPKLQNRIEDCNLILYIIDARVPERVRLDIFERVNGSVPLTRQQVRNCLYLGSATRFLREQADSDLFRLATGNSLKSDSMRDREFVNRFCAFQLLGWEVYGGDMDGFLAESLKKMNELSESELAKLAAEFRLGLANNLLLFGCRAFRRHAPGQDDRSVLNAALWDVMSTGSSRIAESSVSDRADEFRGAFQALLSDEQFNRSITCNPNSSAMVRHRFQAAIRIIREVFG